MFRLAQTSAFQTLGIETFLFNARISPCDLIDPSEVLYSIVDNPMLLLKISK